MDAVATHSTASSSSTPLCRSLCKRGHEFSVSMFEADGRRGCPHRALRTCEGPEFRISEHKRHWIRVRALLPQARSVCEHCSNDGKRGSLKESLLGVHAIIMYPCQIVAAGQQKHVSLRPTPVIHHYKGSCVH